MRKRFENPIPFEERCNYLKWLSGATKGNSSKYSKVIERAIYPDELSQIEKQNGIQLMEELENILKKKYLDNR